LQILGGIHHLRHNLLTHLSPASPGSTVGNRNKDFARCSLCQHRCCCARNILICVLPFCVFFSAPFWRPVNSSGRDRAADVSVTQSLTPVESGSGINNDSPRWCSATSWRVATVVRPRTGHTGTRRAV